MNEPERDDDLERFLQHRSPLLKRLSSLDADEPSGELDRIVLERARSEVGAPRAEPRPLHLRWAFPVALAATLVIAFSVVLQMGLPRLTGTNDTVPVVSERELARDPASESSAPATAPHSVDAAADTAADTTTGPSAEARTETSAFAQPPPREVAASPPPPPMPMAAPATTDEVAASSAPATVAEAAAAPPVARARADAAVEHDKAAASRLSDLAQRAPRENTAGASAPMERKADATATRPAEEWLAYIRELRAQGETAAADAEWEAFRTAYPNHPIVRGNTPQP